MYTIFRWSLSELMTQGETDTGGAVPLLLCHVSGSSLRPSQVLTVHPLIGTNSDNALTLKGDLVYILTSEQCWASLGLISAVSMSTMSPSVE